MEKRDDPTTKEPLRELTDKERDWLEKIAHSRSEPISHVIRAKEILSVADGKGYSQAAALEGRISADPVADLIRDVDKTIITQAQITLVAGEFPIYSM